MHLKYSKGSRQEVQRHSALQAVAPNSEIFSVACEPQRGQATRSSTANSALLRPPRPGGAIPAAHSFSRAASDMRAVLQAGEWESLTAKFVKPAWERAASTPRWITLMAGQPV